MFQRFNHSLGHVSLLVAVALFLYLPNLGTVSLWDIDEGNNATAAREMLESGNWVVPTFNYQLRVDKPALLYWLQIGCYQVFGVGEFAARLPSALAALAAVLLTYVLGCRLFQPTTGLLAGLILASTAAFSAAAHFANPDALLNTCTILTFLFFWQRQTTGGRGWTVLIGLSTGLGFLAKGPVGLVLPLAVIGLYLLWSRQLRQWLAADNVLAFLVFVAVALPWYVLVGAETKGEYLRGFFLKHNLDRFRAPMEGHQGPAWYYVLALLIGFAPWSICLGPALWYGIHGLWRTRPVETERVSPSFDSQNDLAIYRFLWCWIAVYFLCFSLSSTKLPNYILPLYPAVALLTGRYLDRWRQGFLQPPEWIMRAGLICLALIGLGFAGGLLVASGVLGAPALPGRSLPGLEKWASLGLIPIGGAALAWWFLQRAQRNSVLSALAISSIAFLALLAAGGTSTVDAFKAPRPLAHTLAAAQCEREIRIGCYQYFQPSLVFYCRHEVRRLEARDQALEFLQCPLPAYLFLPAAQWEDLEENVPPGCRVLGRHYDLYRGCEIVLVSNR